MKIVVAVDNDKKTLFKRIGRAPFFAIYEDEVMIETVVNVHAKSHEDDGSGAHNPSEHSAEGVEHHRQDVMYLKGYDVILTQAVGPNMKEALQNIGLKVQKISKADGSTADEVVKKFWMESQKAIIMICINTNLG